MSGLSERPRLVAIGAMASNRVIGAGGKIPWHLPEDFRWFKRVTMGHPIVMGRKTWESLGRPLPGRRNLVLTRGGPIFGAEAVAGPEALVRLCPGETVFVIGGAEIYRLFMPWCSEVLLTVLPVEVEGDVHFPAFESDFGEPEIVLRTPGFEVRRYVRKLSGDSACQNGPL